MLKFGFFGTFLNTIGSAAEAGRWDDASEVLRQASDKGVLKAASLFIKSPHDTLSRTYGLCQDEGDRFLLASISKPMSVAALMTLWQEKRFRLDDKVSRYLPEFHTGKRSQITVRQLLVHTSGLPDQLPENQHLRRRHAKLSEFVAHAIQTPLLFTPGSKYSYSSMGVLLASEIAHRISGIDFSQMMDRRIFQPLNMVHSSLGLGRFRRDQVMRCQVENAAPESGAGSRESRDWDWNSMYWQSLGSPWGGVFASARDVARFFAEFLQPGKVFRQDTARTMLANHNPIGMKPRGLGFDLGQAIGGKGCSAKTFGHGGSTGTLAWADPATSTICVVLTTLPSRAVNPHPRTICSNRVAAHM